MSRLERLLPLGLRYGLRRRRRAGRIARARVAWDAAVARLGPGDVAVDLGANVGLFTRALAATGAEVVAVEPDPDAFAALSATCAGMGNVRLIQAAVGVGAGEVPLYRAAQGGIGATVSTSTLGESRRVAAEPALVVRQIDVVALFEGLGRAPALVKMDIEGAELPILEHLIDTGWLARLGPVFVETHEKQLPSQRARTFALIDRLATSTGHRVTLDWE